MFFFFVQLKVCICLHQHVNIQNLDFFVHLLFFSLYVHQHIQQILQLVELIEDQLDDILVNPKIKPIHFIMKFYIYLKRKNKFYFDFIRFRFRYNEIWNMINFIFHVFQYIVFWWISKWCNFNFFEFMFLINSSSLLFKY